MWSTVTPICPDFKLIASSTPLTAKKPHAIWCYFISHTPPYAPSSLLSGPAGYGLVYGYYPRGMVICQVTILLIYVECPGWLSTP